MSWSVYRMWRVQEDDGARRRGTFTLCRDLDDTLRPFKGILDFDDGTRIDGGGVDGNGMGIVIVEPTRDEVKGQDIPGHIRLGDYELEVRRKLPVTAPTVHQYVVSAPVIPRIRTRPKAK